MSDERNKNAQAALAKILNDASGFDLLELDQKASFLELGFDSLFLIQFTQKIKSQLKVKVSFRQLIEEIPTLESLVAHVAANAPELTGSELTGSEPAESEPAESERTESERTESEPTESEPTESEPTGSENSQRETVLEASDPNLAASPVHTIVEAPAVSPSSVAAKQEVGRATCPPRSLPEDVVRPSLQLNSRPSADFSINGQASGLEQIITQQNLLMSMQLQLLSGGEVTPPAFSQREKPAAELPASERSEVGTANQQHVVANPAASQSCQLRENEAAVEVRAGSASPPPQRDLEQQTASEKKRFERFGPYKPVRKSPSGGLTDTQQQNLDEFIARFIKRTSRSREHAQKHRTHFADPRGVAGYRRIWKSIVYQISVDRSAGSKLWDIDGNEYIDIAMGFGLNLFGQSPEFVTKALHAQLDRGVEVGPQFPLAGEVAQLLCDFSRKDRVTFCNTGSEAVMAAMRLARTVTGKSKVVFFNKDYHGNFEEVLLRSNQVGGIRRTQPAAPGVPQSFADSAVVLDYGSQEALDTIEKFADEIAAVLVEPVQSADPSLQPKEFLHELRRITKDNSIALIMDEVISGFRAAPGGAQEWFGVWGDMATYGKVLGGGLPIGALAGSSEYMDALDGGMWRYEDLSEPTADMTFFAGTFVRHPLAIAAAHQILMKVKEEGPDLQQRLTQKTTHLVASLNDFFEKEMFPFRLAQFSSLFRFMFPADLEYADLLYFHLLYRGIFTRGWGDNCFLSTEHSEEDVQKIIDAVKDSCIEIRRGGFLPHPGGKEGVVETIDLKKKVEAFALTEGQMEIWLGSQMSDLANCAYNEPFSVRLVGELNVPALQQAIEVVFQRHDALHLQLDRTPRQAFVESPAIEIPIVDLSSDSEALQQERLRDLFLQYATLPYDLEKGPLVRFTLLRLGPQLNMLLVSAHHIVCDGWSWNVLLTEIGQAYQAFAQGGEHNLEAPASYAEYVEGLSANQEEADESLAYWLAEYQEVPPPLELPIDRPRLPLKSYRGATLVYEFDQGLLQAVKQAAANSKVSLFSFVFTAFNVFLSKLSGQADLVVTVPTAGQLAFGNPNLVGHCVNLLPVRTFVDSQQPFRVQLQNTAGRLLSAYDHQHCTLGEIVKHLKLPRNASRLPLAEVNFNLERVADHADFGDIELEVSQTPKSAVNFDLFFNLCEYNDRLRLDLDYATDLFDPETMQRWVRHFEVLLRSFASDIEQPIERVSLLDEQQMSQVVSQWNQTASDYQRLAVHQLFEQQVEKTPRSIAIKYRKTKLNYAKLNGKINQLAHYLQSQGAGPGSLVGLHINRSEQMVIAALAILKTGAAFVPLDPEFPAGRLDYMIADAAISHLVTETALLGSVHATDAKVICVDRDASAIARMQSGNPMQNGDWESPAYVLYTSGSTGNPKGVVVPHRALSNFLQAMQQRPGLNASDALLGITTLSFDISMLEIFLPLIVGARLVIADRADCIDGKRLGSLIEKEKVTVLQATPATWQLLIHSGWTGQPNLKILCGGEPLALELAKELTSRCRSVWNMYGPTETTIWSSVAEVPQEPRSIDLGVPIANTAFYILDSQLTPVPHGVAANLFIGGDGLALGYLKREQLTRQKFVGNPFVANSKIYDTGDIVRRLANGRIEYVGRRDSQVKIRGFRIELGEIENRLGQFPEVEQACVVARSVRSTDPELVAYVVAAIEPEPSVAELRDKLRESLPEYMVPMHFVFMESLPLTPNLKVDRQRLPAPDLTNELESSKFVAPRTDLERRLADAFTSVLGVERVGIDDNFFDLGGHSLAAAKLLSEIEKVRGERLPLSLLLQAPTPRLIANALGEAASAVGWGSLVPIHAGGTLPPLYCVHAAGGNVLLYRGLAKWLGESQPVWGLQSDALRNGVPRAKTVEEMARGYVEEIVSNHPDGQIHLCGYCLGGSIAYEIAQQLTKAGRDVGLVALFDTHSNWKRTEQGSRLWQQLKFHAENLALSGVEGGIGFVGEKLQEANRRISRRIASRVSQAAYYARLRKEPPIELLDQIYDRASEEYVALPYAGRVVVFKPRQAYAGYEGESLGWDPLVEDLKVIELPVYPAGMLVEPFVRQLADHMRECLDEATNSQ